MASKGVFFFQIKELNFAIIQLDQLFIFLFIIFLCSNIETVD